MQDTEVKRLVNKIFKHEGETLVKNWASEFSDGFLFQKLFNILYEERIDCKLVKSNLVDDKLLNWNRINAVICFNYLQQEFYLVSPTMRTLAAGRSSKAILKLLRILINTSQGNFGDLNLPDECIQDIADVITADVGAGDNAKELEGAPGETEDEDFSATAINKDDMITFQPRGAIMTSSKQFRDLDNDPRLMPVDLRVSAAAAGQDKM